MRRATLTLLLFLVACRSGSEREDPTTVLVEAGLALAEPWTPPPNWADLPPADFEALVLAALPDDVVTPLSEETRAELARALERQDQSSIRAAVILGRSRDAASGDVLLARLQERVLGPERGSDAGDVVAAAALARFPDPRRYWRVVRMADGQNPHPDLEVRVECASTALAAGYDQVIPFLLKVLRLGTWDGADDERDFAVSETTDWARTRAAQALSARAGIAVAYRAQASIAAREREARRLERRLERMADYGDYGSTR